MKTTDKTITEACDSETDGLAAAVLGATHEAEVKRLTQGIKAIERIRAVAGGIEHEIMSLRVELADCRKHNKAPSVPCCQQCGTLLDEGDENSFCPRCIAAST